MTEIVSRRALQNYKREEGSRRLAVSVKKVADRDENLKTQLLRFSVPADPALPAVKRLRNRQEGAALCFVKSFKTGSDQEQGF